MSTIFFLGAWILRKYCSASSVGVKPEDQTFTRNGTFRAPRTYTNLREVELTMRIKRWVGRGLLVLLALFVLCAVFAYAKFWLWRSEITAGLTAHSSVIQTARGPIEYATLGQGSPVLILHGTPGGYDQIYDMLALSQPSSDGPAIRAIIPSRPGYLRTPLYVGKTPEQQADAFAALLDALHIHQKVGVIGGSGGGPSAIRFVLQYPDRCAALILESAIVERLEPASSPTGIAGVANRAFQTEFGRWLLADFWIDSLQKTNPNDPEISALLRVAIRTTYPFSLRQAGHDNDAEQERAIGSWPLQDIRCPTLIIQGTDDKNVPFAQGEYAHEKIPGSQLVPFEGADHFVEITKHKEVEQVVSRFLNAHLSH
jgi:pimeloyl-ACP methyl ester carboxylesterase